MTFSDDMALLFTVYGTKDIDKPGLLKAYRQILSDLNDADFAAAVQEYINKGRFFPKPAELREAHQRLKDSLKNDAAMNINYTLEQRFWLQMEDYNPTMLERFMSYDPTKKQDRKSYTEGEYAEYIEH